MSAEHAHHHAEHGHGSHESHESHSNGIIGSLIGSIKGKIHSVLKFLGLAGRKKKAQTGGHGQAHGHDAHGHGH